MDVYLVPVAVDRYELYCEEPDDEDTLEGAAPPEGFFKRMAHRVRAMLAEAERERRHGGPQSSPDRASFFARVKARTVRWAAEWIAEQRLLWQLRGKDTVSLIYPDDLTEAQARQLLKRSLQRDWERHRFWMIIDSFGLVGSGLLILVPGPNFIGYYFLVRTAGHFFSLRGARNGLVHCKWNVESSAALASLRAMVGEAPDAREEKVRAIADALRLEHFASFFQRSATP
jgi:hypothetical protein